MNVMTVKCHVPLTLVLSNPCSQRRSYEQAEG